MIKSEDWLRKPEAEAQVQIHYGQDQSPDVALSQSGAWPHLFSMCSLIKELWLLRLSGAVGTPLRAQTLFLQQSSLIRREQKCTKHLACQQGWFLKAITTKRKSRIFTSVPLLTRVPTVALQCHPWGRRWLGTKANLGLLVLHCL